MQTWEVLPLNNILVVGGGPSSKKHYDECKKFKGTIVSTDVAARRLMENGVYPDYIVTAEAAKELTETDFFFIEETKKHQTMIITSPETRQELVVLFQKAKIPSKVFTYPDGHTRLPDVGLTAVVFARVELKADRILLIGFEHEGDEYPEFQFRTWVDAFWWFVWKWPSDTIVNCSEGGKLYGMKKAVTIKESTLKEWI